MNVSHTKSSSTSAKNMFGSLTSAGKIEICCLVRENQTPRLPLGPTRMEGDAKTCVGRYCDLGNKNTEQLFRVSTPCVDNHHVREEESESVEESSNVCSCIVLICLYLGRIGRHDILLSANHLARAVTE